MKVLATTAALIMTGALLTSCSTDAGITVSIQWEDNEYFSNDADCYVAAVLGVYSPASGTFNNNAFDQEALIPGTDTEVSFSTTLTGISPVENFVVYVYYDNDGNGKFNEGDDLNSYENEILESDGLTVELTPYY